MSILRPLRGLDNNLYENLESSFTQAYPKFEIIFSVAQPNDQAVSIVRALQDKYPDVDSRLIIGEDVAVVNPKIQNLMKSYKAAKYDILWIADSNALNGPNSLANAIPLFDTVTPRNRKPVGMVHHVPFAIFPDLSWGARVEQAFLCTTHAKMYLAINKTEIDSCIMGKSTFVRKSDLDRTTAGAKVMAEREGATALQGYGDYLGEDNMIGHALWHQLGLGHAMNSDVVGNSVGRMTLRTYFWRRVRWIRVR